jgi:hypothetical protein
MGNLPRHLPRQPDWGVMRRSLPVVHRSLMGQAWQTLVQYANVRVVPTADISRGAGMR